MSDQTLNCLLNAIDAIAQARYAVMQDINEEQVASGDINGALHSTFSPLVEAMDGLASKIAHHIRQSPEFCAGIPDDIIEQIEGLAN